MTERQQRMQKKTAAYEALDFLRRFYPWRITSPLHHSSPVVRKRVSKEDAPMAFLGVDVRRAP